MNLRRKIFTLLSVVMMIIIFMFSAKDADTSTDESLQVGLVVGKIVVKNFEKLPEPKRIEFARNIDHYVRKSAHFTEYMILGFFLMGAFAKPSGAKKADETPEKSGNRIKETGNSMKESGLSLGAGALYAVSDEIHQIFVPGRSCQAFDVLIDSSGVLTGTIIMLLFLVLSKKAVRRSGKL